MENNSLNISSKSSFFLFILFFFAMHVFLITPCTSTALNSTSKISIYRETLEVRSRRSSSSSSSNGSNNPAAAQSLLPPPSPRLPPCSCLTPPPAPPPSNFVHQRIADVYPVIQAFKATITCDPQNVTSTWTGDAICSDNKYKGFFCDTSPDDPKATALASVDFNGFGLCAPTVSAFVDKLPDLALFHANSNNFTGVVPDLTKLKFLYELDLSNNHFSGQFPSYITSIPLLLFLDLRFNSFSGAVPPSVFGIPLAVLFLNNNNFNQPLPSNLGSTPVKYLVLANNGFTGPIPLTIGSLSTTLAEILLLGNKLSGCLPYEIGFLNQATVFDVSNNQLTGPIPYSFGCLSNMEQLVLAGNYFYGEVPEVVCSLTKLDNLSLSDNFFTGIGKQCRELVARGKLDISNNCIPGFPMQRHYEECWAFQQQAEHCPLPSTYHYIPCNVTCNTTAVGTAGAGSFVDSSRFYGNGVGGEIGGRFGGGGGRYGGGGFGRGPFAGNGFGGGSGFLPAKRAYGGNRPSPSYHALHRNRRL